MLLVASDETCKVVSWLICEVLRAAASIGVKAAIWLLFNAAICVGVNSIRSLVGKLATCVEVKDWICGAVSVRISPVSIAAN